MKKICYIVTLFLCGWAICGCQDVDEPKDTTKFTVTTDTVYEIGMRNAWVSGQVDTPSACTFLLSLQQDLSDADEWTARPAIGTGTYQAELTGLLPNTTYYVALCATDGYSKVVGNVQCFKTLSCLGIREITVAGWNEHDSPLSVPSSLGVFLYTLTDAVSYPELTNALTEYENGKWQLPLAENVEFKGANKQLVVYSPFQEDAGDEPLVYVDANTDFLYGSSEVLDESHPEASIVLQHAMAKVTLEIKLSEESLQQDFTVGAAHLCNLVSSDRQAIALAASIDCRTGECEPDYTLADNDGLFVRGDYPLNSNAPVTLDFYVIPTSFAEGEVQLNLYDKDDETNAYSSLFGEAAWEGGKQYVYPVAVLPSGLQIGEVRVEDWQNNEGGSIIINK